LIPALLRVELHAQECFLLLRGPAKSAHFRACARIQTKKELLICWSRRPQAVHHLVAILRDKANWAGPSGASESRVQSNNTRSQCLRPFPEALKPLKIKRQLSNPAAVSNGCLSASH